MTFATLTLIAAGLAEASAAPPFPQPFDVGATYTRELHVDAAAAPGGDGSRAAPFQTIAAALYQLKPGTKVWVAAGNYGPIGSVRDLQGTAEAPIAIVGVGEVVIDGGGKESALHLADPRHVVIEGLTIRNTVPHGMNIDDGGSFATPAGPVVLRRLRFERIGDGGNHDCLKLSGVTDFYVEHSRFSGCNQGEGIDMVGCHRGVITGNTFADMPGIAVQTKGGSADVLIHGNRFERIGQRAINAGGHTGRDYFRPLDAPREAERIRMIANVIERTGNAPVAFSGCGDCVFAHNTVIDPGGYVARIIQENAERQPGQGGYFINNVVVLDTRDRQAYVDVRKGPRLATFTFGWNLWHATDDPAFPGPSYPRTLRAEDHAVIARDPPLDADGRPREGSPAIGAGRVVPGGVPGDFERRPYGDPPTAGAFAGPRPEPET